MKLAAAACFAAHVATAAALSTPSTSTSTTMTTTTTTTTTTSSSTTTPLTPPSTTTSTGDICTDDFHGVRIKDDNALIELGAQADVQLLRTGNATLEVVADDVKVHGDVHAERVFVDGVDVADLCDSSDVVVWVDIMTGTAEDSESPATSFVEFYIPGKFWTPAHAFAHGGAAAGEVAKHGYSLPGEPTKLRLSTNGEDAWGIAQVGVTIGDDDELFVRCSPVVGVNPEKSDNGYWVSTDPSSTRGSLPPQITIDLDEAECSSFVTVSALTLDQTDADTANTVYVEFLVNGTWTDAYDFFTSSDGGDRETNHYALESAPTALAFTLSGTDMWAYDHLAVTVDGEVHVVACEGTARAVGSSGFWLDNSNADVLSRLELDIEHDECALTNVTLSLLVGAMTSSGTDDDVEVRFKIDGNWSDYFPFIDTTVSDDNLLERLFRVDGVPTDLELHTYGDNAFGIGHMTATINNESSVIIVCNAVYGVVPAQGNTGHWIDGDGSSGMPSDLVISLTEPACTGVATVTITADSVSNSGTTAAISVNFFIDDAYTGAERLFNGISAGKSATQSYGVDGQPTKIKLTSDGGDAFFFAHLTVELNGELFEIVCDGSHLRLDNDGSDGETEFVFDFDHNCDTTTMAPVDPTTAAVVVN